jgi:predicted Zn-dependent protease with MMP-like domain
MILWLIGAMAVACGISWWKLAISSNPRGPEELEWKRVTPDLSGDDPEQKAELEKLKYSEEEFQEMVANALDEIPEEFDKEWENVAVIVSTGWVTDIQKQKMRVPKDHVVFGTYSGIDRTQGLRSQASSRHVITIYQPALELRCGADKELLEREIRRTVMHELAHHLGMSHARMKEIGL